MYKLSCDLACSLFIDVSSHVSVVHSDGVRQSGLYVAISCIWEQLKDNQEVDIFQAVRELRYHRPQIIHDMVSRHELFYCRNSSCSSFV